MARLGGDEFVVLQSVGNDRNAIDRLAEDLITAIARPLVIDGNERVPSTSVGIAIDRRLPAITPSISATTNTHSRTLAGSRNTDPGVPR